MRDRTGVKVAKRRTTTVRVAMGALLSVVLGVAATVSVGASTAHNAKVVVVTSEQNSKYGAILVSGHTLYVLTPNGTACSTTCKKYWPPLVLAKGVTAAKAGQGVDVSKIGSTINADGTRQVTYGGKPLYFFSGDSSPGQVKGNVTDTWGKWSVVVTKKHTKGSGTATTNSPSTTTTSSPTTTTTAHSGTATTTTTSPGGGGVGF